ncbi:hypothetical protein RvY_08890 [Ramazzottius varieornatus]|uniref:Uncharacterized protein n=1 Tax=Ramazzottius varieornatus TaxID=947166 RepID=A0A1D1V7J9_RAMVA|nr:hypothetical protein RvY_08890 [Ramazzottius varieornatus]
MLLVSMDVKTAEKRETKVRKEEQDPREQFKNIDELLNMASTLTWLANTLKAENAVCESSQTSSYRLVLRTWRRLPVWRTWFKPCGTALYCLSVWSGILVRHGHLNLMYVAASTGCQLLFPWHQLGQARAHPFIGETLSLYRGRWSAKG